MSLTRSQSRSIYWDYAYRIGLAVLFIVGGCWANNWHPPHRRHLLHRHRLADPRPRRPHPRHHPRPRHEPHRQGQQMSHSPACTAAPGVCICTITAGRLTGVSIDNDGTGTIRGYLTAADVADLKDQLEREELAALTAEAHRYRRTILVLAVLSAAGWAYGLTRWILGH